MKTNTKEIFSLRLDTQTIALIRSRPQHTRSAWLRSVIAAAVQKDAA